MAEPHRIVDVRSMQLFGSWPDPDVEEKIMYRVMPDMDSSAYFLR
jgi:hypothetical protein